MNSTDRTTNISIVTPAFNEAGNLEEMYRELVEAMKEDWEWLIVDDHSVDHTFSVAERLAASDPRVRCIRLSRNFGAHAAATCGLHHAVGRCAVIMACDLQDPPQVVPELVDKWKAGASVVWAVREAHEGVSRSQRLLSGLYHRWMGKLSGLERLPAEGADFVLVDRNVLEVVKTVYERNTSLHALIAWLGFDHVYVPYTKRRRHSGESGWSFSRRVKLAIDSIIAFSYVPMRLILWLGFIVAFVGFVYALFVVLAGVRGAPVPGWSSTMIVVLVLGGTQMVMIGVIGQYLWRALDEIRRRPLYVVERATARGSDEAKERES